MSFIIIDIVFEKLDKIAMSFEMLILVLVLIFLYRNTHKYTFLIMVFVALLI